MDDPVLDRTFVFQYLWRGIYVARIYLATAGTILWEMGFSGQWIALGICGTRIYEVVPYWNVTGRLVDSVAGSKNEKYMGFDRFTWTGQSACVLDDHPRNILK